MSPSAPPPGRSSLDELAALLQRWQLAGRPAERGRVAADATSFVRGLSGDERRALGRALADTGFAGVAGRLHDDAAETPDPATVDGLLDLDTDTTLEVLTRLETDVGSAAQPPPPPREPVPDLPRSAPVWETAVPTPLDRPAPAPAASPQPVATAQPAPASRTEAPAEPVSSPSDSAGSPQPPQPPDAARPTTAAADGSIARPRTTVQPAATTPLEAPPETPLEATAPSAVPVEADVAGAPGTSRRPGTPPLPARAGGPAGEATPARGRDHASARIQTLTRQLAEAPTRDALVELDALPDGWQRRRAVDRLLDAGVLDGIAPEALLGRFGRDGDRVRVAARLLEVGRLGPEELTALLPDGAARRLGRRARRGG
ncbi:hypothetical protein [Egicoccus halophilus]|uniref:Uncharacterized protein n=1 Tax=Egicoccus halophilus TaxID=1670830 RepID=A0A8J3AH75_9ACTN|nr:hypothetical protein [Egicoccus halophilus]GGI09700.1 hypothetical protein GCM10011354_35380 [Egicoccus halophilus]